MSFRYYIISCSGEVFGTNDISELPVPADSDDAIAVIDTLDGTYTNDDDTGSIIAEYEPESSSDDDDSDD